MAIGPSRVGDLSARGRWARGDLGWALAIGGLALLLRLAFVLEFVGHPIGQMPWVDEGAYWTRALEIRSGDWLPGQPFYQDPLFPYALAALMCLVGQDIATLRVALACLGSMTPVLVFLAGRRGLGRAEGIVAGLATAAYGPLVFTDGLLEKEGLAALAAALALGLTARMSRAGDRPAWSAPAGFAWGVVALLRANALAIGPLGAAWALIFGRGPRRRIFVGTFLLGFVVALGPAVAVNAVVGRPPELLVTTWQAGANFYIGNGPGATGTYSAPDFVEANPAREADDFAAEARRRSGRELSPGQVSRYWFGEGLRRWREAPAASLRLLARKAGLVLHDFEIPDNQDLEFVRLVAAPRLAWGVLGFGWLAPCAALGLARSARSPFWWFLVLSSVAGLATTAMFFVVARYRIPWIPGLALLAASGAVDLARKALGQHWASVAWRVALLVLPAGWLAWRPMPDPVPDRWGHALITLALADLGAGRLDPAIDALDDARALGPGPAGRVADLLARGPVHDRVAALIAIRLDLARRSGHLAPIRRARWLRQLPEGRAESRRLIESALKDPATDREALREGGGWWLGEPAAPRPRRRAGELLARAALGAAGDPSASILRALLEGDPRLLADDGKSAGGPGSTRLDLARAILVTRPSRTPHP